MLYGKREMRKQTVWREKSPRSGERWIKLGSNEEKVLSAHRSLLNDGPDTINPHYLFNSTGLCTTNLVYQSSFFTDQ
eukprot:c55122_g1_i1 orf=101-331(-)